MTRTAFTLLVAAVALQRLAEVAYSRRNERMLMAQGAREHAPRQLVIMKALHGAWLLSMLLEVCVLEPPFRGWLAAAALTAFSAGQTLRLLAMRALGPRWTVRIITLPGANRVTSGPYRYLRHPNYVGVVLEIAALPLVHGAIYSAVAFSIANLVMLGFRIRAEEHALDCDNPPGEVRSTKYKVRSLE